MTRFGETNINVGEERGSPLPQSSLEPHSIVGPKSVSAAIDREQFVSTWHGMEVLFVRRDPVVVRRYRQLVIAYLVAGFFPPPNWGLWMRSLAMQPVVETHSLVKFSAA